MKSRFSNREKRKMIIDALRENPDMSDNEIAEDLGVSHNTVKKVRKELERKSVIPKADDKNEEQKSAFWKSLITKYRQYEPQFMDELSKSKIKTEDALVMAAYLLDYAAISESQSFRMTANNMSDKIHGLIFELNPEEKNSMGNMISGDMLTLIAKLKVWFKKENVNDKNFKQFITSYVESNFPEIQSDYEMKKQAVQAIEKTDKLISGYEYLYFKYFKYKKAEYYIDQLYKALEPLTEKVEGELPHLSVTHREEELHKKIWKKVEEEFT